VVENLNRGTIIKSDKEIFQYNLTTCVPYYKRQVHFLYQLKIEEFGLYYKPNTLNF
jgi:hypothetical protein